jgi:CRP-like cAMP-binding protein
MPLKATPRHSHDSQSSLTDFREADIVATLLRPLLGHLDANAIDAVKAEMKRVHLPASKELFHQGDTADGAYVVHHGNLRGLGERRAG